jgi:hypothetical protein
MSRSPIVMNSHGSIDLIPSWIPHDHPIKQWKDRVRASTSKTLGELNDLRIVMSPSPGASKSRTN